MVYLQPISNIYHFCTPKPTPPTTTSTNHHSASHHSANPYNYISTWLSRMLRLITNLPHTNCMWQPPSPPKQTAYTSACTLSSLQIHVRTSSASVGMFQRLCVHLSILSTTSSVTAAASAPPPVASWCGYGSTYNYSYPTVTSHFGCKERHVNMKQSNYSVNVVVTSNC